MKPFMQKFRVALPAMLMLLGFAIVIFGLTRQAEAKYQPSPTTLEMSKDIKTAQEFVKEYEIKVLAAKNKANVYRETICRVEKEACTKDILDPANSGVDLSGFLAPAAK